MRWLALITAALLVLLQAPAVAGTRDPDPRILVFDPTRADIFHVPTAPGATQLVLFAPGEAIQSVITSDPRAYAIAVSPGGDSLSLRQAAPSALAMVTVRTSLRSYELELSPAAAGGLSPPVIRFVTEAAERQAARPFGTIEQASGVSWQLSGSKAVQPLAVRDDGRKTYIDWSEQQAMPAIFAIGPSGKEEMVDGYVRDGIFTIDRVHGELVFRIDKAVARAKRLPIKGKAR